ncbi:alpha/beta hydrolase [Rhodococcus ruber]|nr:alpha/beta hydrolase [Rhodococcus ruber]QDC12909.1 alpha/beta fold hydrolase [Rhodococcus ruber]QRE79439.1 alpha/beta hydrolase [Rhodococcus ruber]
MVQAGSGVRIALVLVTAAVAGAVTAATLPVGPVTTVHALAVMTSGLLLGAVGGWAGRSAWMVVPLVLAYGIALEIVRLDVSVPTIDDVRLDSIYGVLALTVSRGLHAILLVLPMLVGARLGVALTRRRAGTPPGPRRGLVLTSVLGVLTLVLAALIVRPASTPAVLGPDGQPVGVAALETVSLGGDDHALMIRAADPGRPVLLYLSGGPGQSDMALARALAEPWVDDVVFATYDQRGNGKSYGALFPTDETTLERVVADTVEVAEYLRDRFDEDRIYLMGESWGTILGVRTVQQRPDLFAAYLGSGQMVNVRETDRRIYRDLQEYATRTGDTDLAATLQEIGEPPYADIPWANAQILAAYDHLYDPYEPAAGYRARGEASGLDGFGILGTEYSLIDKANVLRGLIDTFTVMYPQIQDIDFRRDATRLEVPVYILDGAAELDGRRELLLEWFTLLDAPEKRLITFDDAAHAVAFEQADAVEQLLRDDVIPRTSGR